MTPLAIGGVAIAGVGGSYLAYDYMKHRDAPEAGTRSLVAQATNAVQRVARPADVPAVKVGMPLDNDGLYRRTELLTIDAPNTSSNTLQGIARISSAIMGRNLPLGGHVFAAFASCESQTGNLSNSCYNCSLFNIHWYNGCGYPSVRIGDETVISFRTGAASDSEGFRRCIEHFKAFLERRAPAALAAAQGCNFDAFQVAIAQCNYSPGYTATVLNGSILPGRNFLRQRYDRLVRAGLI